MFGRYESQIFGQELVIVWNRSAGSTQGVSVSDVRHIQIHLVSTSSSALRLYDCALRTWDFLLFVKTLNSGTRRTKLNSPRAILESTTVRCLFGCSSEYE